VFQQKKSEKHNKVRKKTKWDSKLQMH